MTDQSKLPWKEGGERNDDESNASTASKYELIVFNTHCYKLHYIHPLFVLQNVIQMQARPPFYCAGSLRFLLCCKNSGFSVKK